MSQKEPVSTSWADESDDVEESAPKTKESNAWAKGNPWGITAPKGNEGRDSSLNDFPAVKGYVEKESKRDDRAGYEREDGRSGGASPYGRKEDNYGSRGDHPPSRDYQSNRDYPSNRENYRRESSGYGREGRESYNREDRGYKDYQREDRNYGREDRTFRDYPRREDNDRSRPYRSERPPREPVPFPDQPPYTAFIGNLSFDVTEQDLLNFFGTDCKVDNVRLLINRETNKPKGFGYIQFQDLDSLKTAVAQNGEPLLDRPLRIDVAEAKPDDRSGGGSRNWGNRGSERPPKTFNTPSFSSGASFQRGDGEESFRERPKLDLKPRSDSSPKQPNEPGVVYQGAKSNPFGEAKPRDESLFLKKVEEKAASHSDDRKNDQNEDREERSPKVTSPSREFNTNESNNPPSRFNSHESRDRRTPQKRDDKTRRDNGEDKPFVRGSNSKGRGERVDRGDRGEDRRGGDRRGEDRRGEDRRGDKGGFKKDERNFPRGERPKERTDRPVKPLTQEVSKVDVTSTNLFSALQEEEN